MTVLVGERDLERFLDGLASVAFPSMLFVDDYTNVEFPATQVIFWVLGALKEDKANGRSVLPMQWLWV